MHIFIGKYCKVEGTESIQRARLGAIHILRKTIKEFLFVPKSFIQEYNGTRSYRSTLSIFPQPILCFYNFFLLNFLVGDGHPWEHENLTMANHPQKRMIIRPQKPSTPKSNSVGLGPERPLPHLC